MSISVEATQILCRGASEVAVIAASRVAEHVFGADGPGRSKGLSTGLHISQLGGEYNPRLDSCISAFVRLL